MKKSTKKPAAAKKVKAEGTQEILGLSGLAPARGSRHRKKRLGFGEGSGHGKTCGKGQKGQGSRSGYEAKRGFEGGQVPLQRRIPKVGFNSRRKTLGENIYQIVPLKRLSNVSASDTLSLERLLELGLIRSRNAPVKILGGDEVKTKFSIEAHAISASARAAIEKAGGEVRILL